MVSLQLVFFCGVAVR